jgi:hypothetical protein
MNSYMPLPPGCISGLPDEGFDHTVSMSGERVGVATAFLDAFNGIPGCVIRTCMGREYCLDILLGVHQANVFALDLFNAMQDARPRPRVRITTLLPSIDLLITGLGIGHAPRIELFTGEGEPLLLTFSVAEIRSLQGLLAACSRTFRNLRGER